MGIEQLEDTQTVILTGIYGVGKSTVAEKTTLSVDRVVLSLDSTIRYAVPGEIVPAEIVERRDTTLYEQLTSGERILLDGLPIYDCFYPLTDRPVNFKLGTRSNFLKYLRARPTVKVLVLTCRLDTWLNERLPLKFSNIRDLRDEGRWNPDHPEWNDRKSHYQGFYQNTLSWLIENAAQSTHVVCTENLSLDANRS